MRLTSKPHAAIEIEHMCTFFVANGYFQIKTDETRTKPESDEFFELQRKEELAYEEARNLRKELLREAHNKAETLMNKVNEKVNAKSLVIIPEVPPFNNRGGIESRSPLERLEKMLASMENQATQIKLWRDKTIELLLLTLVDEEESVQGDEYECSTKRQDEVRCREKILNLSTVTDFIPGLCVRRRSKGPNLGSSRSSDRSGQ